MVERAVNDRSALPILANILLETTGSELVLTATDLDVGVRCRLALSSQSETGAVTLPARRLTTIIRELSGEEVTLEVKKNHTATLSCGTSWFRLQGLPPEDFPIFPSPERLGVTAVPQLVLKTLVLQTAFAMSLEETRFILNGALLSLHNGTLSLVATDGRRLAIATTAHTTPTTTTGGAEDWSVVVPAKTIRELGRLLQEHGETAVTIAPLKDNQLVFQFDDVTVITRLVDGQFPQYESVIPPKSHITLTCPRQPLTNAIRRASLMTTATSQAVVFELSSGRLVISKESPELGSAREELAATYTGEPMAVAFNPEFWLEALKVLEAEELTVELTAPEKPAVVRLPDFTYVVLPMKLA